MIKDDSAAGHAGDGRSLSAQQWEALKQDVIRGAREARAQELRRLVGQIAAGTRQAAQQGLLLVAALVARALATADEWGRAYALWRERRQAVRELGALDDRALKDFGINRSEIESVVYGRDSPRVTEGRIAATLFHKPYDRRSPPGKRPTKPLINKTAA